jgi:pyruvate-ferredoxin/flavodoxin oxidoreductase
MSKHEIVIPYPGIPAAMDGNSAVIACEQESSDAAGAFPITPSTQMGEYWAEAAARGHLNIAGRPLIFIEPEGEHAAAAVTAGLAMGGLRAANFSSGQGIAYMHESLYAAVGKRLTYVLNMGCRAMTKATLNVHAGHDDYHCVDDTGFFQLFAKSAQHAADLNIIAHRISELALNPGIVAQDGFLTTHLIESLRVPERQLIDDYLGKPDDIIDTPTPAQRMIYGPRRRRIPELWDVDNPVMAGVVQNQDSYMQSVAAQRPFFFDHIQDIADEAFNDFFTLTGRRYARLLTHLADDADYLIVGQGSVVPTAEAVADYLRKTRRLKIGVVDLVMFRPFPADLLSRVIQGKKGVVVLERLDQPLAADLPLAREIRAVIGKSLENGRTPKAPPHSGLASYRKLTDMPEVYSACFGLGSRDLQPEGLIGAVENMLEGAAKKKFFYLGMDFVRDQPLNPKEEIQQQQITRDYPNLATLSVHGSENPILMPSGCTALRMHSIGGWGAITTGKNLATTLFDLFGLHIKANPKYGSEKKGQPTTFYLAAADEPIRVNHELVHVDVVLSPDPNVFHHTNALAGLQRGGTFIIQSDASSAEGVWSSLPERYRQIILDQDIRLFYLDAFRIAREEATDPELQLRMQGIAFHGAFFAATPLIAQHGLDETHLLQAIERQLEHKFGGLGARVVQDNLRVIKRGFDELTEVTEKGQVQMNGATSSEPAIPIMVKNLPQSSLPVSDIHRFWEETGSRYARGLGNDTLADPFMALSVMPASTALFRDMTGIRTEHPEWIPENCTACGKCWSICPDTAMPALVNSVDEIFDTAVAGVKKQGLETTLLPKATRVAQRHLQTIFTEAAAGDSVRGMMTDAFAATLSDPAFSEEEQPALERQLNSLEAAMGDYQFALTRSFHTLPEKDQPGSGGLLSITVNPTTCKGCGECIAVCDDDALRPILQTPESIAALKQDWSFWLDLPSTDERHIRIDDLEEGVGILDNILLRKDTYLPFTSGDGACLGCSEKTVLHLFTATVEALMLPRVKRHLGYLDDLLARLEKHVQLKLIEEINVDDTDMLQRILAQRAVGDLTLADLAEQTESLKGETPIDPVWLARMTTLIADLKDLRWRYQAGPAGRGRAAMGIINATGCSSVWGSTFPFNPYPFPWANHLFQDSPSMALGVFEAHMAKMADGFRTIRMAEIELKEGYRPQLHDEPLARLDWRAFTDEEFALCPPVVAVGGDGAMYDIGLQNLSRAMMSGKPIKVVVLDTQVYSNTGGQACTSGFLGQISDMAPFGEANAGKQEARKELALIALAHRTTYVAQATIANVSHLIESFIRGLTSRRPALFNCYTACQPEHGIGDDMGYAQAKLAVESRAYPIFRFDPDLGDTPAECLDLSGNPAPDADWPAYTLNYRAGGRSRTLDTQVTFADFAATETRFRKHFRTIPASAWQDDQLPLADYLDLEPAEQDGKLPFVWHLARDGEPRRLAVSDTLVAASVDRRQFWHWLNALAGTRQPAAPSTSNRADIERELVSRIASSLTEMATGNAPPAGPAPQQDSAPESSVGTAASSGYMAPWLETDECTACDECTQINTRIFAYNDAGKAYIKDADGGPYADLVKAAERCTARVIHPGLPRDPTDPALQKWIERARKYN